MLIVAHNILPSMIIPPNTDNYPIEAFCSGQCTKKVRQSIARLLLLVTCSYLKFMVPLCCNYCTPVPRGIFRQMESRSLAMDFIHAYMVYIINVSGDSTCIHYFKLQVMHYVCSTFDRMRNVV